MKKTSVVIIALLFSQIVISQKSSNKFDIRLGTGISLLGSGDINVSIIENELNMKLNSYFATSLSINYGKNRNNDNRTASFIEGNFNLLLSPFKNTNKNDFRIGTGITFYNITDSHKISSLCENGVLVKDVYQFDTRSSLGYNVSIENSYWFTDKFLVGVKVFTQPFINGDINTGVLLKFGIKL
jgi:hypothetical protein